MFQSFWSWYERNYRLNITIAAFLFLLQIVHLYWLSTEVVLLRLVGPLGLWPDAAWLELIITLVDYTEIPALITTSLIYINEFRQGRKWRSLAYLLMLNSQWLHVFWITDEFVIDHFVSGGEGTVLPHWLAWVAIGIDYLELPVIIDLFVKIARDFKRGDFKAAAEGLSEH